MITQGLFLSIWLYLFYLSLPLLYVCTFLSLPPPSLLSYLPSPTPSFSHLSFLLTLLSRDLRGVIAEKFQRKKKSNSVFPLQSIRPFLYSDLAFLLLLHFSNAQPYPFRPLAAGPWVSSENSLQPLSFILSQRLSGRLLGTEYVEDGEGLLWRACKIVRHKRKILSKNHLGPLFNEACHHLRRTKRALFHLLQCLRFDFFHAAF